MSDKAIYTSGCVTKTVYTNPLTTVRDILTFYRLHQKHVKEKAINCSHTLLNSLTSAQRSINFSNELLLKYNLCLSHFLRNHVFV